MKTFTLVHPQDRLETLEFSIKNETLSAWVTVTHYGWEKSTTYHISRAKARKWYDDARKRGWYKTDPNWATKDYSDAVDHRNYQLELSI